MRVFLGVVLLHYSQLPVGANLLDQIQGNPTAEQSEQLLSGLSPQEKKNLLLSLLDDKKPAADHGDSSVAAPAKDVTTSNNPGSEMTQEQWQGAMMKEQENQKPDHASERNTANTHENIKEKEWKTPFGDVESTLPKDFQRKLDLREENNEESSQTFDLPEINEEAYRRQKLLSLLEATTGGNENPAPAVTQAQANYNSQLAVKIKSAAHEAMQSLTAQVQGVKKTLSDAKSNFNKAISSAKNTMTTAVKGLADNTAVEARQKRRKALMDREAKIIKTSMENTKELTMQKLTAVMNDYRAQFNQQAAEKAMLEAGNATLFARLNYMAVTVASQIKVGLDTINASTKEELAIAKNSATCGSTAGIPTIATLERDPVVEDFYKATIPELKEFVMNNAGGGISGVNQAGSLLEKMKAKPGSFAQLYSDHAHKMMDPTDAGSSTAAAAKANANQQETTSKGSQTTLGIKGGSQAVNNAINGHQNPMTQKLVSKQMQAYLDFVAYMASIGANNGLAQLTTQTNQQQLLTVSAGFQDTLKGFNSLNKMAIDLIIGLNQDVAKLVGNNSQADTIEKYMQKAEDTKVTPYVDQYSKTVGDLKEAVTNAIDKIGNYNFK